MNILADIFKKENKLEDLCDNISQCAQNIDYIASLYKSIKTTIPIVSYANFRDAFTHFRKAYEAYDEITLNEQCYAAKEHMQRSIKDPCVHLARIYIRVFHNVVYCSNVLSNYQKYILEEYTQLNSMDFWRANNINSLIHQLMYDIDIKLGNELSENTPSTLDELKLYEQRAKDRSYIAYENKYSYIRSEVSGCFFYVMHQKQNLSVMRKHLHRLNTAILELRENSVGLIRTYIGSDNKEFNKFCAEIKKAHTLIENCGLSPALLTL